MNARFSDRCGGSWFSVCSLYDILSIVMVFPFSSTLCPRLTARSLSIFNSYLFFLLFSDRSPFIHILEQLGLFLIRCLCDNTWFLNSMSLNLTSIGLGGPFALYGPTLTTCSMSL